MRAVVQRVNSASVMVENKEVSSINKGLLVLLGIKVDDTIDDINYIVDKLINLRIFEDDKAKLNLSMLDLNYELMVVSQFTLYGDCRKGRRPSFIEAARPDEAKKIYDSFISICRQNGVEPQQGIFQADMKVNLENDGPVTVLLDSRKVF